MTAVGSVHDGSDGLRDQVDFPHAFTSYGSDRPRFLFVLTLSISISMLDGEHLRISRIEASRNVMTKYRDQRLAVCLDDNAVHLLVDAGNEPNGV